MLLDNSDVEEVHIGCLVDSVDDFHYPGGAGAGLERKVLSPEEAAPNLEEDRECHSGSEG